jgi:hypothetical protein
LFKEGELVKFELNGEWHLASYRWQHYSGAHYIYTEVIGSFYRSKVEKVDEDEAILLRLKGR